MNSPLTEHQQQVIAFYTGRTDYDNEFTISRALELVELADLQPKQRVLDVATGTGIVAIACAEKVGTEGKIIGVDITPAMLERAKEKIIAKKINNIQLIEADIENMDFPEQSFDLIFCASAIVLLKDISAALTNWYRWLKSGGQLIFSSCGELSYFTPLFIRVFAQQGVNLSNLHHSLGTAQRCYQLLEKIGFKSIEIKTQQKGKYLSTNEAEEFWCGMTIHPETPLLKLDSQAIEKLTAIYKQEITALATEQGVWQDITTFLVSSRKPN